MKESTKDQRALIVRSRVLDGKSFSTIGEELSMTAEQARRAYLDGLDELARKEDWCYGLDTRVQRVFTDLGLESREDVIAAYNSGRLNAATSGTPGYSWGSHVEVARWLGFPEPDLPWIQTTHGTDHIIVHAFGTGAVAYRAPRRELDILDFIEFLSNEFEAAPEEIREHLDQFGWHKEGDLSLRIVELRKLILDEEKQKS